MRVSSGLHVQKQALFIHLGEDGSDLPLHLLSGEKEKGYIVKDGIVTTWQWHAVIEKEGSALIAGQWVDVLPFSELKTTFRPVALDKIRELAQALMMLPEGFLDSADGFIETWRIYIGQQGGFLFLPKQLSTVITYCCDQNKRTEHYLRYLNPSVAPPFALCHQLTQFLYLAAAGFAPYQQPHLQQKEFQIIPLELLEPSLDPKTCQWIDTTLSFTEDTMRSTVSSAYSAAQNLSWFLEQTEPLLWHLGPKAPLLHEIRRNSPSVNAFCSKQEKRQTQRQFLKKRGPLLITVALALLLILGTTIVLIRNANRPSEYAALEPTELIMEFFAARNALDVQKMGDLMVRGAKNPYEKEVSALMVQSRMRQVYEQMEAVVNAANWLAQGSAPIAQTAIIYGCINVQITQIDQKTYLVAYDFLYPQFTEEPPSDTLLLLIQSEQARLKLTDEQGYWQIASYEVLESELTGSMEVETYPLTELSM